MTNSTSMIERCADAIRPIVEGDSEISWALEYAQPIPGESLERIVQAALEAMLSPTPTPMQRWNGAVQYERVKAEGYPAGDAAEIIFKAMITTALNEDA